MTALVLFLVAMGLLDSLNPFSIGLQIALLPLTKKAHHSLFFILGTFVTYFCGGLLIYFGVNVVITQIINDIDFTKSPYIYIELILGIALLALAIKKSIQKGEEKSYKKSELSVKPISLFLLGAGGTIFDLPTAIPYLAVLGKMAAMNISIITVILLLIAYCLIYLLPMISIYFAYILLKQKAEIVLMKIKGKFDKIANTSGIIFSYLIAVFLIFDSILSISGKPIIY